MTLFYDFYGLNGLPFEERLAPEKLLTDERMAKGLDRLEYFLQAEGLAALLTGPTGVGKTSLLRLFLGRLPVNRYQSLLLSLTTLDSSCLLRMISIALGEKPGIGKDRLFAISLDKIRGSDRFTVLILDEAHLLTEDALTDLRLLLCAAPDNPPKLRMVLCGQDSLLHTLGRQTLADLLNRVAVRVHLAALSKDQTACYIDHRLLAAGGTDKLFSDEAKDRLHDYAAGVPRILNNLATLCLIQGAAKKQKHLTPALVDEAAQELRLL